MAKPTITEEDLTEKEILLEIYRYVRSIAWIFYVSLGLAVFLFFASMLAIVLGRS